MAILNTTSEFEDELDDLAGKSAEDAGLIDALIEAIGSDAETLDALCREVPKWHFLFRPPFEIKRFEAAWQDGRRIYVLKPYDENGGLIPYRIFVGYDIATDEYFALSVQPRTSCYDTRSNAYASLCYRYDALDIPGIRRI